MRSLSLIAIIAVLSNCAPQPDTAPPPSPSASGPMFAAGEIETDANGRCFTRTIEPTATRIIEEQIIVAPEVRAADGTITSPAIFRNVSGPRTVTVGEGDRFETLCPPQYTPELVATLQRALKARQAYAGPITGNFDTATRTAVRAFQTERGTDSTLVSVEVARRLGVVALSPNQINAGG